MALRVWLPLNGSLENVGVSDAIVTNTNGVIDNNGKIGKCYTFGTGTSYLTIPKEAMTEFSTECSVSFWLKIISWNTNYATFFQAGLGSAAWNNYIFGFLRNNANSTICFTISNGSTASNASYLTSTMELNRWYHVALTYSTGKCSIYLDGVLDHEYTTTIVPAFSSITTITAGICNNKSSYQTNCSMNDLRIYDHCLSAKEVKEIAQGLILHYKLNGFSGGSGENLALDTANKINTSTGAGKTVTLDYGLQSNFNLIRGKKITISADIILENAVSTATSGSKRVGFEPAIRYSDNTIQYMGYWIGLDSNPKTLSGRYSTTVTVQDKDFQSIAQNGTYIQGLTSGTATIKNIKVELGDIATPWSPAPEDLGINTTKVTDSSGFGNDGDIVNTITTESVSGGGRYQFSTLLPASTSTYIINNNYLIKAQAVSFWLKLNDLNSGLNIFSDTNSNLCFIRSGNSSGSILAFNVYLQSYTGTSSDKANDFRISTTAINFSDWNFFVIEKTNGGNILIYINGVQYSPTGTTGQTSLGNGLIIGKSSRSFNISDFRLYSTELSGSDILDLYHTPANIDNLGGMHGFEFVEDNNNSISKNGIVHNGNISQYSALSYLKYDPNIYFESDGSAWVHIYHHNHPDLASFASTDTFSTSVKKDDNRWFNATEVCNQLNKWEFLIKYRFTEGGTIYKERWIQTKNPEAAVFGDVDAADITRITGDGYKTGTWGGLYKKNGSAYWVMNNGNSGNWWGATGSFSIYQGGIPGYGGTVTTTGYNDLYVRIDNIDFSNLANAKITANNLYLANNFIEK